MGEKSRTRNRKKTEAVETKNATRNKRAAKMRESDFFGEFFQKGEDDNKGTCARE